MALFGSKKKTDAADAAPDASAPNAATPANAAAPAPATVVKEKKVRSNRGAVKNGTIVGLNIGNTNIKAVEVVAKNGDISVTRAASIATPPDAFQNGNVLSVSALANAIKALWKAGNFKGKAVISSVAGTGALVVRVIEVPLMTDAQLADAMRADAQLYIPFPPTEVQMDFKALRELPSDPDSGTMDVLLAAAQSEIIDLHIKTLQAAKLDPRAVDVEPIAAGRTLTLQKRGDFNGLVVDYNEITAIANIGSFGTEISLLRGDVLVFTRTVSTGGNTISQGIADALGTTLADGERIKIEQGDALPPEGYQSGQMGSDEFGFGDTGTGFGGDFEDFGLGDVSPAPSNSNRTTVLDAPEQSSEASADPFDLDFFNQGPKNEPGGGHAQKEGQPNPGGSFSFDDLSLLPASETAPAPQSPTPPANPSTPSTSTPSVESSSGFNFDFDLPSSDLPSSAPSSSSSPAVPVSVPTPTPTPGAMPINFGGADQGLANDVLPAVDPAPPGASASAPSAPMSSAFDFSDFDLPAATSASSVPLSATPLMGEAPVAPAAFQPAPAQGGGFSFGELPEVEPAPTPSAPAPLSAPEVNDFNFGETSVSLEKTTPARATSPQATPVEAKGLDENGLDISDVFGSAPASDAGQGVNFDELNLDETAGTGLNLGGMGAQDDFGFGTGGEEFGGFGAGLSASGEAGSAAIYDALANSIEELAGEISRSLSFYLERVPDAALSRIYLTGGGALLKNLDVFLTGRLGAPTSLLNPLQLLPVAVQSEIPNGPFYTVALGLALRDFVD